MLSSYYNRTLVRYKRAHTTKGLFKITTRPNSVIAAKELKYGKRGGKLSLAFIRFGSFSFGTNPQGWFGDRTLHCPLHPLVGAARGVRSHTGCFPTRYDLPFYINFGNYFILIMNRYYGVLAGNQSTLCGTPGGKFLNLLDHRH